MEFGRHKMKTELKKKDNDRIRTNIIHLRERYQESQSELASAIDVASGTIANYETGDRYPTREILKKIARHYQITMEELTNGDIPLIRFDMSAITNIKIMNDISFEFFPVICTDKAMKSENFKRGFVAHQRFIESVKANQPSQTDLQICFNLYEKSYNEENVIEALANELGLIIFFVTEVKFQMTHKINKADIMESSNKKENLLKKFYLKDMNEVSEKCSNTDINEIEDIEEEMIEGLKELKSFPDYSDLADYYIALSYVMGCVKNERSEELNKVIGAEMMSVLLKMDNKYSCRFLEIGKIFIQN